jgi:glutamate dehydrogenase/leucine dehydrogenase
MAVRTNGRAAAAHRGAAAGVAPLAAMAAGGHEQVVFWRDRTTGLRAIVAIHDTTLGPALGGTRMYPYPSEAAALEDVLRLARAMTYKNAAAGLDHGGGKAVIIGDPAHDKSELLFRAYGRFVDSLGGRYITTTDVGTAVADLDIIRRETVHVAGCSPAMGGSGDTSLLTGVTVYRGMQAAAEAAWGDRSLRGRSVLVQGAGKVGWHVLEHLYAEGATLLVADVDQARAERAAAAFAARVVAPDAVFDTPCDIFSPNALGGVLNDETIPRLRCAVVCGGANNQLAEERHARALAARGILYAPDFIVNCGGVINVADELMGYNAERARARADAVYETTRRVFARAREAGITPEEAANQLAEERIRAIGAIHRGYVPRRAAMREWRS